MRLMASKISGDFFLVVTPVLRITSGKSGKARFTRFCTSTWAMLRSTPFLNVTVRLYCPSLVLCENMYNMSSTPLTCCSIGAATVSATTWALAPGYWQGTLTVRGAIGGYISRGNAHRASAPAAAITIARPLGEIGRARTKRDKTAGGL